MTHPIDWPSVFASNPGKTDAAIGRLLGYTRAHIGKMRNDLGLPVYVSPPVVKAPKPERPPPRKSTIGASCDESTKAAVDALAHAEGVPTSVWALQAIVERMERVQQRMAYLTVKEAVDEAATDYIGHP